MSTVNTLEVAIKEFISANILNPLASVSVNNRDASIEELVAKYIVELDLPATIPSITEKSKKKKNSPKTDQKWLTYDQYSEVYEQEPLCGDVQTRGKYKDRYCGVTLDDTNVVTWSSEQGFTETTATDELNNVEGKRTDMRCKFCWSRDPKTGEYKRKKGRGDKLISEHKGDIVAPTVIPGVSVPDNTGLMGFLSGNTNNFQSPTRAMGKVIRAKRFPGLEKNEDYSHVIPNPDKHPNMSWLIRADNDGQVVIGKFSFDINGDTTFEDGYLDDLVVLDESDLACCKEYNIEYDHYTVEFDEIPVVKEPDEDTNTIQDLDIPILDIDTLLSN